MCVGETLRVHSPDCSTFLRDITHGQHLERMTSYKIGLSQLISIYSSQFAKSNPIWNDGALGFLNRSSQQEEKQLDE